MVKHFKPLPSSPPRVAPLVAAEVDLLPGDVALAGQGESLRTLLGSCVSVILTDPRRTVAAMCHIVHVGQPTVANLDNTAYGPVAMDWMFQRLIGVGVTPGRCEAYVFGGGNMFPQVFSSRHVGLSNAEWALDFLHSHGIEVRAQNLGGTGYRKVSWTVGGIEPVVEIVFSEQGNNNGR